MDEVLVLDGGTGRELKRRGAPFRQPEWSALALIDGPAFVSAVHAAYVQAGANVITTNSYAVVPFHLGAERFVAEGEGLASLSGRLAREVANSAPSAVQVAGSLPPICGSYRADLFDAEEARPILATLIRGLSPFVDLWLAETLSTIAEAELVRALLGDDGRPLWLSFTLSDETVVAGDPRLRSGQSVSDAVAAAVRLGAAAVLFNCSQPEVMADAVRVAGDVLRQLWANIRIGVYANAFPPQKQDATANAVVLDIREDLTPEGYLAFARAWQAEGANIIGGCCGIGPEHIAALRQQL